MLQDIRYALRSSLRGPAFAILVVLTLGVGIGANSTMFSIVNSVLLQPLPYERSEELVYLYGAFRGGNQASISPPDFLDYRARQTVFSSLAARTVFGSAVIGGGDRPERVPASIATPTSSRPSAFSQSWGERSGRTRSRALTTSSSSRTDSGNSASGRTPSSSAPASPSTDAPIPSSASCRRCSTA